MRTLALTLVGVLLANGCAPGGDWTADADSREGAAADQSAYQQVRENEHSEVSLKVVDKAGLQQVSRLLGDLVRAFSRSVLPYRVAEP